MDLKTTGAGKRYFITLFIFAAGHFILKLGCMIVSIGSSMRRFDDPSASRGIVDQVVGEIGELLMQPGAAIWNWIPRSFRPDLLEWLLFFGNSLLWGAVLAAIFCAVRRPSRRHRDDKGNGHEIDAAENSDH